MIRWFREFMNRYVQVKFVLPAYLTLAVTALSVVYVQQTNIENRDRIRADQIAMVAFEGELREYEFCLVRVETRNTLREVLVFLIELESVRGTRDGMIFREYLDDQYPLLSAVDECGVPPDVPVLNGINGP